MPIVQQNNLTTTTTAGDIVNCVSQDVRAVLQTSDPDLTILLDYVNRVTNELLRFSRWKFLEGGPQVFLTIPGITDYYIGSDTTPTGTWNTGLGLDDVFTIKQGEFIDRSNQRRLGKTASPPVGQQFSLPAKPKLWRNDPSTPYTVNIYPPPNSNPFQFVPYAAMWTITPGGSLGIRTYYIKLTFGDNCGGQSAPSIEQIVTIPANFLLTVQSPVLELTTDAVVLATSTGPTIDRWSVYVSTNSGSERLQSSGITLGTNWTESGAALSAGVGVPSQNTLAALGGYVMEFNYYQTRQTINDITQIIQIPDTYKDIVCAGTNWLAFKYLEMDENAQVWKQVFEAGKVQMIKDANLFPRGEEFIRPDSTAVTFQTTTGIGLDSGLETSLP